MPPTHPDLGNGKLDASLATTFARIRGGVVLPGPFARRIVRTPTATRVNVGNIGARMAWGAVTSEQNAYPGRLNVGSRAQRDLPHVMTRAVTQDTLALPKISPV